jgi:hypothetical protein
MLFRTDGVSADYSITIDVRESFTEDTNKDAANSEKIFVSPTNPVKGEVWIYNNTFDWYRVEKSVASTTVGHNFSLKVTSRNSLNVDSELVDGKTIHFVTVLHVIIYHEDVISPGKPTTYRFVDHRRISQHMYTKLDRELEFSSIVTLPTKVFKHSYIGFFVESYGINKKEPEVKLYPFLDNINELTEGWCQFIIEEAKTSVIKRPELSKISVKSMTTNNIYGRTYDNYKYSIVYKQQNNNEPFLTQISVFGTEGEIREDMTKITPGGAGKNVWKNGCKYEFTVSGAILGEGDHHVFQLHFKDQNTYAVGTVELGKSWHGPFISNNLQPYVRPTAPDSMVLYEDDNTTFFDLNTIFEDADLQENLNFTITDPELEPGEQVWGKEFSDELLTATIVNETRLRIDLVPNGNGQTSVLLNVSDSSYFHTSFEFTIIVMPVNDPPQVIEYFDKLVILEDDVNTDMNLYENFDDPIDLDKLEFWVENNNNIDVEIDENGFLTITPKPNWYGKEYIDFFASDGIEKATDFLKVIVKPINDEPLLLVNQTIELWQDQWGNFTINAFDIADNESVIISQNLTELFPMLINKPEPYGYSFNNATGYLTFKPTNSMVGTYSWNISAKDHQNSVNFSHVTLIINNVNDPPVPKILYPANGARFLTTDKISFRGRVSDPDREIKSIEMQPITLTWFSTLHGERVKIGSGPNLEPTLYEAGTHTIRLIVDDGEYKRNTTIVINIFAINKNVDTDDDGIPDYWENLFNLNINDPHDAKYDYDRDTFSNWEEYMTQTDPRDSDSFPEEHVYPEGEEEDNTLAYLIVFMLLIVILALLVFFMFVKGRRKKREEEAEEDKDAEGDKKDDGHGIYKAPKVLCHECGASLEVMTLNRPVVITCNQCGKRGAVY